MIEDFSKLIPKSLLNVSGSVFYSGRNAFNGKSDLYILGLNPGGSAEIQKNETIEWHTNKVLALESDDWSEYKDGIWAGRKAGTSGLQPRVLHCLKKINLSPYNVPASNICFVRSPRESDLSDKLNSYANLCWDFHEEVIRKLEIKVILCFGKTSGNFVRKKIKANELIDKFTEKNNRKWTSEVYKNNLNQVVICATHPSIADWTNDKTDISRLVFKHINKL